MWGSLSNRSKRPNSSSNRSVDGCTVSPRKSRRKSPCFSNTTTSTPARARSRPANMPAGPPPTTTHVVFSLIFSPLSCIHRLLKFKYRLHLIEFHV
ncbi:Uncharacterised protein [Mycobacteroides abscessus subsp. abscessus]|nr:Uncharacterised protein [Mycobacteroides abscessus subsp. abscessus]